MCDGAPHRAAWFSLVVAAGLAMPHAARGSEPDPVRGGELYALHCGKCHSASVHGRPKRIASGFAEIRRQVIRWSDNLGLGWTTEDVDDVAVYLNGRYYRYQCPPQVCTVISRWSRR